ncbi:4-hydroxythreonine-4-phosphate dehydrogenase PdxA [uncultured Rhodoblastus sp.]|uniref:4-hydroxythreonine-4-phosphate dehydrogenase PdxA n=1 Tax=uncultured Rhodoblastus sp. TaxID=543037 RepID=UPI0025FAD1F0|nr:4-hydroxythreonine-4-phosphate dehydrogenase PdxA [uncultured Rhodoblastus sp.]
MTGFQPPLCMTQGDPSGIGPDLALALYAAMRAGEAPLEPFILIADPGLLHRRAKQLKIAVEIVESTPEEAASAFEAGLPAARLQAPVLGEPGRPDPADGPATVEAIARAVEWVASGRASAIVTNPIAKSVLYRSGFAHPGHTEFLGELAGRHFGGSFRPVMLLWSRELAVVPATVHVPLARVPSLLNTDDLVAIGEIAAAAFTHDFGIAAPRLVFSGLNPHAGEEGAIGREEIETIAPAVARLAAQGIDAKGPFSADTLFHAQARDGYDVAVCMYHDQALIPIKTLAFDSGVNVTLGLPFIRTSPDHGTAFDLAGTGRARLTSLREAVTLAARMARARA